MSILTPLALINWKANTMHISDNSTYPFISLHFSGSARFCNQCSLLLLLEMFWINNRFIFLRDLFSACKPFSTFTSNRCFAKFGNEIQSVFFWDILMLHKWQKKHGFGRSFRIWILFSYYFKVTFKWEKEVCKTLGRTSYQQENMFLKELTLWNQKFPQDPLLYNIFICEYPGGNSTEIYVSWNWWSPAFGFHWESK